LAAARKAFGTTTTFAIIPQQCEKFGLGPVAVLSQHRREGIAMRLIERGIARAQVSGWEGIFVLGDPDYYRRFGFAASLVADFASRYAGPHFMALALKADGLPRRRGEVGYPRAFEDLD
jgi:putative acetyltransferase